MLNQYCIENVEEYHYFDANIHIHCRCTDSQRNITWLCPVRFEHSDEMPESTKELFEIAIDKTQDLKSIITSQIRTFVLCKAINNYDLMMIVSEYVPGIMWHLNFPALRSEDLRIYKKPSPWYDIIKPVLSYKRSTSPGLVQVKISDKFATSAQVQEIFNTYNEGNRVWYNTIGYGGRAIMWGILSYFHEKGEQVEHSDLTDINRQVCKMFAISNIHSAILLMLKGKEMGKIISDSELTPIVSSAVYNYFVEHLHLMPILRYIVDTHSDRLDRSE